MTINVFVSNISWVVQISGWLSGYKGASTISYGLKIPNNVLIGCVKPKWLFGFKNLLVPKVKIRFKTKGFSIANVQISGWLGGSPQIREHCSDF